MQIRRVHAVYFSGTGTTEKTVRRIAAQAAQQLGAELSAMDFTPPQARQETLHFAPEELVIFGVPTYAGRVPNVLLPFLKERVQGGGLCARLCPMGSIDPAHPEEVRGICIKCCACVKKCPAGAKYFDDPGYLYHQHELEEQYTRRAQNKQFI